MTAVRPARTFSVSIPRPWRAVYEAMWRPEAFGYWASGMAKGHLRHEDGEWRADGPDGPVTIRFTPHNDFGVMDHVVVTPDGEVAVPLRVVANGDGAEVMLTLFRLPAMDDARFATDGEWIERDLRTLRDWLVGDAPPAGQA